MAALITGASSGLGAEFATQLAAAGHDVVLVARSATKLELLATKLERDYRIHPTVIVQDLGDPNAAERILAEIDHLDLTVTLLVNNAGFGTCGRFEEIPLMRDHQQLMVNVVALADLTHALIPGMLKEGAGHIINVASTAAFQPSPYFAVYSAAKAFVLNFSLALREEYRDRGIAVLAVCPGPVETAFFDVIGTRKAAVTGKMSTPQSVVSASLKALKNDRGYVVPSFSNFMAAHLIPRRPRTLVARLAGRITRQVLDTEELRPSTVTKP
ncbi:MAG: SDR family oxidoreductase [Corynebacteriales bacterium]|nr:SDR family oxidoreductase [Mycobacteriales bacterium]